MPGRIRSRRRVYLVVAVAILLLGVVASATAAARTRTAPPSSLVVLGESDALGQGSDPAHPYRDVPANSWATGTNPAVESIYARLLAANPSVHTHAVNLASDEAGIDDLAAQVAKALRVTPRADLVIIQLGDDVRCDDGDQNRVTAFGVTLGKALDRLSSGDPNAKIFLVSSWGTFASYVAYLKGLSLDARLKHAGKGPCQMVSSPSGAVVASHVAYIQKIIYAYNAQLASVCRKVANCRYDGGAAQRMSTSAADISLDQEHMSLLGNKKLAAVEWPVLRAFIATP